jgi:Protein of unknown function (DUF4232)
MCVSTPRRCLGNSACGFPVVSLEPAGHPVDSGAAESGCRARLAAPCEARTLRASLFLQVATGSLVGSAVVRNMGRTPCSLLGRPRARLVGTRALETAWRVVPARSPSPDLSAIYDPPSSLRGLAQGRAAWVPLRWSNWCPPGTSETSTGPPPDALVLVLPHRRGNLRLRLGEAPRCDAPDAPSTLAVALFTRGGRYLPASSRLRLRASILGVPARASKLTAPVLRARRGGMLRYSVVLMNVSALPFRFRSCPTYLEQLSPKGKPELYVLNCRPMGTVGPRARAVFAMVLRVPADAPLGVNGLGWELAPRTYLPPFVGAPVLVTR